MHAVGTAILDDLVMLTSDDPATPSRTLDQVREPGVVPVVEIGPNQYAADLRNFIAPALLLTQTLVRDYSLVTGRDPLEVIHDLRTRFDAQLD